MGQSRSKKMAKNSEKRNLNILMYGLNGSGKTQLMYTGLVGNEIIDTYG